MQDPEAEPSYTDAQLYSKAEKRVAELRIAVRAHRPARPLTGGGGGGGAGWRHPQQRYEDS